MEENQGPVAANETDRVRANTDRSSLEKIDRKTEEQVRSRAGSLKSRFALIQHNPRRPSRAASKSWSANGTSNAI